jgi:phytol kinase
VTGEEWLAIGLVLVVLGAGLPLVRLVTLRCGASPEVARKAVHVGMGLLCTGFPWLFDRPGPVWALALAATVPLLLLRCLPALRSGIGAALHGVKRPSYGEVLFAPSVAAVFDLSGGDAFLHCIPCAVLTLADAAGALGGTRWGKHRYGAGEGFKSMEGSAVFFVTAVACVLPPLWLGGRTCFQEALWIALILGLLAMMAEGLADRGFDNLVIPLGCFFVLDRLLGLEPLALALRFGTAVFFLGLVMMGARWSTLSGGALLGCALLGYSCAVLADFRFMLPPLAVFICHMVATRRHRLVGVFDHRLDAVLSHAIGCLPWVIAVEQGWLEEEIALAGVSFAMAAQLAMMSVATDREVGRTPRRLVWTIAKGWGAGATPGLIWLWRDAERFAWPVAVSMLASAVVVSVFRNLRVRDPAHATRLWIAQGAAALSSAVLGIMAMPDRRNDIAPHDISAFELRPARCVVLRCAPGSLWLQP